MTQRDWRTVCVPAGRVGADVVLAELRDVLAGDDSTRLVYAARAALPDVPTDPTPARSLVVATSGSTGQPRLVVLPWQRLITAADLGAAQLGAPGRWVTLLPLTGVGGILTLVRSLRAGLDPLVWPGIGGAAPFEPTAVARWLASALASLPAATPRFMSLVPTQLFRLLVCDESAELLAQFSAVLIGGAALAPGLRRRAEAAGIRIVATYGATETCGGVVFDGRPLPGVDLMLDGDEVVVGGPTVATGYWGAPDDPAFRHGQFRTGDMARWEDDRLHVIGRRDQVIKSGGVKVSLAAMTDAARRFPGVADAAAVAERSAEWGTRAHLFLVLEPGIPHDAPRALVAHLTAQLGAAYRPSTMSVVPELPTAPTGKPLLGRDV